MNISRLLLIFASWSGSFLGSVSMTLFISNEQKKQALVACFIHLATQAIVIEEFFTQYLHFRFIGIRSLV